MTEITGQDLLDAAKERVTEAYILNDWQGRVQQKLLSDWHNDISNVDAVYAGSAPVRCTDETIKDEGWKVTNLVQSNADDISRLTEESQESVQCHSLIDNDTEEKRARIRAAIARTWWLAGHGDEIKSELALDYAIAGAMFLACVVRPDNPYPVPWRIDPRYAYPSIIGGRLVDLMVVQSMHAREARSLFGQVFDQGMGDRDTGGYSAFLQKTQGHKPSDQVDVVDYYGPEAICTAIICKAGSKNNQTSFFVQFGPNPLYAIPSMSGRVPVAFRKRPTGNSELRGFLGQAISKQVSQNRLVTLTLDYLDQGIYAPLFERGTDLDEQTFGPETVIHGRDADAMIQRVAPAIPAPAVEAMADRLENYIRNETANPPSRAGDIPQAIASAAFVDATQGERSTLIRHVNKRLTGTRQDWNEYAFALAPKVEAPLLVPVEGRKTYKSDDIWRDGKPETENEVTNSIGSGLGKLNQYSLMEQLKGNGVLPTELFMEQISEIADVRAAQELLDKEQVKLAFMQKLLSDPNSSVPFLAKLLKAMGTGKTVEDALDTVEAELAQMQAQAQAAAAAAQPQGQELAPTGTEGAPANAQTEALSIVKGGVPGNADELQGSQSFQPPPLPQPIVRIGQNP